MVKNRKWEWVALVIIVSFGLVFAACRPPPTGTNVYSKYGFSFEYPAGVHITEEGLFLPTADENQGMVMWEKADETFGLAWFKTIIWDSEMAEDTIDGAIEGMEAEGGVVELVGGKVTTEMSGFDVMYQLSELTLEGEERNVIVGLWYCEPGTTAFWVIFLVTDAPMPNLGDFLSTFECQ